MYMVSANSNVFYICTVAIKNIKNMHAVSTNQIADILHFNDKEPLSCINLIHTCMFSHNNICLYISLILPCCIVNIISKISRKILIEQFGLGIFHTFMNAIT